MVKKPGRKIDKVLLAKIRVMPCVVCRANPPSDPSHIRSRGAGGPDESWNVFAMCRSCHGEWHSFGWVKFLEKYPRFKWTLSMWGWESDDRLWHPKLGPKESTTEVIYRTPGPLPT